jgi:hypothetical protein
MSTQRGRGRPTDYQPALGNEILELMATGLSLAAAAAELGIHRQRVYEWMERYPDFADTVKLAQAKRLLYLERRLLTAADGPTVTSTIFALKNASPEDWRDRREVEVTRKTTPEQLSDDELANIASAGRSGAVAPAPYTSKPH